MPTTLLRWGKPSLSPRVATLCASAAALALIALPGCKRPPETKVSAPAPAPVVSQAVRVGDISRQVTVTGSIVALQDVALSAKQGGRLAEITVREGDGVRAGQILARIDATDLVSQVRSDEASVDSAQAKLVQAQAAYDQQRKTTETAITSARAAYAQQVASSSAGVRSAEAALVSAQAALSIQKQGDRPEERLQKQASLASSQATYKKAQSDLDRYEKLHAAGAVSDVDLDTYRNTRDVAQANLNSSQAAVQLQEKGNRREAIEQAAQTVRQAQASLWQAQAARATDAVKKADLDTAVAERAQNAVKLADVRAAQAALEEARNALQIAKQAVADSILRAPFAGRVSARAAEPGQIVTSATTLLHVIALDSVYFEPSVPNVSVGQIKVGQSVDVTVDTFPGRVFPGKVTRIYPEGSSTSRSFPIRVTLANPAGDLRPQMFAQGRITTVLHRHVTLIPREALLSSGKSDQKRVFTVEKGVAHDRPVTAGLTSPDGDWVEVSDLAPDAQVVTTGQGSLKDGQAVTAIPDAASQTASL